MAAPKGDMPKQASSDKRETIIDAAFDLFRHYGYRRTSMEDIARAAGVAKGTLYLYFASKEELFEAIARMLAARMLKAIQEAIACDQPLEEQFLGVMDAKLGAVWRWIYSSPHAAELLDPQHQLPDDVFEEVDATFRSIIAKLIQKGVDSGELDLHAAGFTVESAAATLTTAAYGAEKAADEAEFRKTLANIVRITLRGLRA
ncbi:MAG: hypothetical protein CMI59_06775 [Parvibaculum sp.]|nr:hypothetical protein [Parvibaculum sp.]